MRSAKILLAQRMGKHRIIAETARDSTAWLPQTWPRGFGYECVIYMGAVDMERQACSTSRGCNSWARKSSRHRCGQATLKEAISEAMRDWVTNVRTTHYILGSALGPHPYPMMVRDFQRVIGEETKAQILEREKRLPDLLVACVGGGSNAIGLFHPFLMMRACAWLGSKPAAKEFAPANMRHDSKEEGWEFFKEPRLFCSRTKMARSS
jgi:tryptophan synthase beta chain